MAEIFRQAKRVIAWLGPSDYQTISAFKILEAIGSGVDTDWKLFDYRITAAADEALSNLFTTEHQLLALKQLLAASSFERLWIRQEVGVAREALAVAGHTHIQWTWLVSAIFVNRTVCQRGDYTLPMDKDHCQDFINRVEMAFYACNRDSYSLSDLHGVVDRSKCSYGRDYLYAILGLLRPADAELDIVPQYSLSVNQVFQDAVVRAVKGHRTLNLLTECELQEHEPPTCDFQDKDKPWPSWVPDWSKSRTCLGLLGFNASSYLQSVAEFRCDHILRVAGLRTNTVRNTYTITGELVSHDLRHIISDLWKFVDSCGCVPQGDLSTTAALFSKALLAGYVKDSYRPERLQLPDLSVCIKIVAAIIEDLPYCGSHSDAGFDIEGQKLLIQLRYNCHDRVLFTTSNGTIGLGPPQTKSGDQICVLLSCDVPMVCRPCDSAVNQFKIVGNAYVDDIMIGEALLGPLPEYLKPVRDAADRFNWRLLNTDTGKVSSHDPRLAKILSPSEFDEAVEWWSRGKSSSNANRG